MNILAAAFVQIIGLAVVRDDCQLGMHVVLPRVPVHIESHTAILAFRNCDRLDDGNDWPSQPLIPLPGYSYVSLNGAQIRFIVNGTNPRAEVPAFLPHLKRSCSRMDQLREGYRLPAYTSAAAVVLIPNGLTDACATAAGRIDTRVTIANTGNYQVTSCEKSVTLRDEAVVAIINAPTTWLHGEPGQKVPHAHSDAYFAMGRNPTSLELGVVCALERPSPAQCTTSRVDGSAGGAVAFSVPTTVSDRPYRPEFSLPNITFECSNTQWP
jgi:hypothetical protein